MSYFASLSCCVAVVVLCSQFDVIADAVIGSRVVVAVLFEIFDEAPLCTKGYF
jgi:hypothetical protein